MITQEIQDAVHQFTRQPRSEGFVLEAIHAYTSAQGEPLFWRIRLKHPRTAEKWIRPMCREGHAFVLKEPAFPDGKPLYRLAAISRADRNRPVFLVEGEKCADILETRGIRSTTSGGADSVEKADWKPLAKRTVVIWPDNDEAGARFAKEAAAKLLALGCTVSVVDIARLGLPPKGDCVDWMAARQHTTTIDVLKVPTVSVQPPPPPTPKVEPTVESKPMSPIAKLAALSTMEYQAVRRQEAKMLGVTVAVLDEEVHRERQQRERQESAVSMFPTVVPASEPVDAAKLLSEIHEVVRSFIVCEPETAVAATLWITFTWFVDHVGVAPLAVITAPEKRCGKSQLLTLIGHLSRRPLTASNITPAALYRVIASHSPTLLIDEVDTFLRDNEELRGVINSGHTRQSAFVVRTSGEDHEPRRFSTWGAKALSGIGTLADTLMDRAVVLQLRRKLPGENVERLRHSDPARFERLASQLARFEQDAGKAIAAARPSLPRELNDRAQDNWEPLLALADHAGGDWPRIAREAALAVSTRKEEAASTSVELLTDVYEVFAASGADRMASAELLRRLNGDEMKRWGTYHRGQPMTARQFAKIVEEFGAGARLIRIGNVVMRGYHRSDFEDAFRRYLSPSPSSSDSSVTTLQLDGTAANEDVFVVTDASTHVGPVTDRVLEEPWSFQRCNAVTGVTDSGEEEQRKIIEVVL